jgi:hypothetical protein
MAAEASFDLKQGIQKLADRFNTLIPIMLEMGILDDILNKKIIMSDRSGPAFTITLTKEGVAVTEGEDPFAHAVMRTTGEQWGKIFAGEKAYAAIFRFELDPQRDAVPLNQIPLVERFSSIMQAIVLLPL